MPLSNDDYRAIREHLDTLLRQAGFAAIIEEAQGQVFERVGARENLRDATILYVQSVMNGLKRRSLLTYRQALEISRESIHTEQGEPISGFSIVTTPSDREFLGFEEMPLSEAPDVADLLQRLHEVVTILQEE